MIINRKQNKAKAESFKRYTNLLVYIRKMLDIYSACEVASSYWLTDREKDFFVVTVINYLNGDVNPKSDESLQRYKKYFNPKTDKYRISDYLNKISNKNWIKYNKQNKTVDIPLIFKEINLDEDMTDIIVRVLYSE